MTTASAMQAIALAPALGVDAASLVAFELSVLRRAATATALQAAWRGWRGRVRAMRQRTLDAIMRAFPVEPLAMDTDAAYFVRAAMRGDDHQGPVVFFDVEHVH